MVIIDDFRKQILYQRLNLGYDCTQCEKRFYSRREQLEHLEKIHIKTREKENFSCTICGKVFGHVQILRLHQQIHALSEPITSNIPEQNPKPTHNDPELISSPNKIQAPRQKQKSLSLKKAVGLTKIKMEDCLRCDACSCIYIDRNDYYKHMRNFHKVSINVVSNVTATSTKSLSVTKSTVTIQSQTAKPQSVSPSKAMCKSCCRHCKDRDNPSLNNNCRHNGERIRSSIGKNGLFTFSMQDNIKHRWSKMVSQRLLGTNEQKVKSFKPDPDTAPTEVSSNYDSIDSDEMSHLLSQVEVRIKTEPLDDE